ncbi:unnamed protein product [Callosobruchus maculatus]|uniref:Uncharacterized protein n=1 Tax=Callosobruchus maculatus TaxID=64391 RepID=A0A653BRS3_CALMS|nr:unnamed protein product [Callosobruchus maculatus]
MHRWCLSAGRWSPQGGKVARLSAIIKPMGSATDGITCSRTPEQNERIVRRHCARSRRSIRSGRPLRLRRWPLRQGRFGGSPWGPMDPRRASPPRGGHHRPRRYPRGWHRPRRHRSPRRPGARPRGRTFGTRPCSRTRLQGRLGGSFGRTVDPRHP